ncbi:hypothetical protein CGCSCA1_v008103 [Colletotrichum siamense]|nr:hypothetical protein CGCSCA1_v008103 [Colletotrichum siamense]
MRSAAVLLFIASPLAASAFIVGAYENINGCQEACPASCDSYTYDFLNCTLSIYPDNPHAYCNCKERPAKKRSSRK